MDIRTRHPKKTTDIYGWIRWHEKRHGWTQTAKWNSVAISNVNVSSLTLGGLLCVQEGKYPKVGFSGPRTQWFVCHTNSHIRFSTTEARKRPCYTGRHKCRKPTDANETPQIACRFYLRPCFLCRLELWGLLSSFRFVVPQFLALESSFTPHILPHFGGPTYLPPSRWCRWHPSYPIIVVLVTIYSHC